MKIRKSALTICILGLAACLALAPAAFAAEKAPAQATKKAGAAGESRDPNYWFDRGALVATYGNNRAAVTYFSKAIALDPSRSGAYFSRGVSYGQLSEYDKALADIDRAIALSPQNGLYYYGRGRVNLLAGNKDMAMQDFRKAADLGDEDARNYLKSAP